MASTNNFKKKLNLIVLGAIVLLLSIGGIVVFTILSIQKNVNNSLKVSEALNNVIQCQSNVRGFLLNAWSDTSFVKSGTNNEFELFQNSASTFEGNIVSLINSSNDSEADELKSVSKEFEVVKQNFLKVGALIKERGFKDLGLEGKLREAAHKLEKSDLIKDKKSILVLRKHEKDFFLRKDQSYIDKFNKDKEVLAEEINALPSSPEKEEIQSAFNQYTGTFEKVTGIEQAIGLNKDKGMRGQINVSVQKILSVLTKTNDQFNNKAQNLITTAIISISGIFIFILAIVLIALRKFIKPVFEPMQSIQEKASKISQGELSVQFNDLENNDVMKDLITGFENIIHKFKNTMQLIEGISAREIKEEITLNSSNDEVSITLNKIIKQVRDIDEEEDKRNWHNEGLAKFAETLRDSEKSTDNLYDTIIAELAKYLGANQGALFLLEGEEDKDPHLALKGCFAYNRKKYLNMRIEYGEGLTGTCWAEAESILLTEIPSDYINITSGLGEALPNSILIVPVKVNDQVFGVIELASFGKLESHKIKFVEILSESIGAVINSHKTNAKTLILLQRSQEMTEELRAQEEEMRQNMEEMQATQEEMKRMTVTVQHEIETLKNENDNLKSELNQFSYKAS